MPKGRQKMRAAFQIIL